MSDHPIDDWTQLGEAWRQEAHPADLEQLRRRIRTQTFWLYAMVVMEVLITIAGVIFVVAGLVGARDLETKLVAGGLGLFTAVVSSFALHNRHGIWRSAGNTIAAYRVLERERLRRRIASARFTWRLCALALVPMLLLAAHRISASGLLAAEALVAIAGCLYLIAWIVGGHLLEVRLRRRLGPELQEL